MKKTLLILALLGLVCLHAMGVFQAREQLLQWTKDFVEKSNNTTGNYHNFTSDTNNQRTVNLNGESYTFLYARAQTHGDQGLQGVCLGVLFEGRLYKGFCLKGFESIELSSTDGSDRVNFTLSKHTDSTPTTPGKKSNINIAFNLIHGTFYLARFCVDQKVFYDQPDDAYQFPMYAVDDTLLKNLQNKIDTRHTRTYTDTSAQDVSLDGTHYTLISQTTTDESKNNLTSCLKIMKNGRALRKKFCMDGVGRADFVYKRNYLTLEFSGHISGKLYRILYITFKVVDGVFYLHQYSEQNFKFEPDGSKRILKTQIIYRQSRDDPYKRNPITIDSLNRNFQAQLLLQCSERGYCM
ncbi:hypothetical protein [Helicobacter suis]|uniref:hypothetical protein n=1 Tax=Helicobacter suis TaxID=104628 RepID=UPI001F071BB2|nr:hypothetical protein [Helicobacter suis]